MSKCTYQPKMRVRTALIAVFASIGMLAILTVGSQGQEVIQLKEKPREVPLVKDGVRSSVEVSGFTRPGNPDDGVTPDGDLIRRVAFEGEIKTFKIMGGTVYFAVFKNTGQTEGDTFGTGLTNFDSKFEAGRSFKDSMSPRYDKKAKYLYLYQIINDRNLDPRIAQVKGNQGGGGIANPFLIPGKNDAKTKPPVTEDIASFALKLITDPRYITSWGHFRDSSFAATVVDVDAAGKVVPNLVKDDKGNLVARGDKVIHTSFSYLPNIVTKIPNPAYSRRARSHTLGDLEAGFGVEPASFHVNESKAYGEIRQVADQGAKGDVAWVGFAEKLLKVTDAAREPDYVQLMFLSEEERAALTLPPLSPVAAPEPIEDEITRAIFRVDWRQGNLLKQGARSVVFGFTTDLPPTTAPIRIDTPRAAAVADTTRLASYFAEEGMARGTGVGTGQGVVLTSGGGVALTAGGADAAALALALGTAVGAAPTPIPGAPAPVSGFAGITGGIGNIGGNTPTGGGGGGGGFPAFGAGGGLIRGGGIGGGIGGGLGGGTGSGNGNSTPTQGQTGTQTGGQTNNFNATLINQQTQNQQQDQYQQQQQQQQQGQNQNQHNHNNNNNHHGHNNHGHHHGNVVPAPASLLLGLLGLPGFWLLRRRKTNDVQPETVA